jgi:hypothetical protein
MNRIINNKSFYFASFNGGNVEVWSSELYSDKNSIFEEMGGNIDEITRIISIFHIYYSDDNPETFEMLKRAVKKLRKNDFYKEQKNDLDFFILQQSVENQTYYKSVNFNNYGIK